MVNAVLKINDDERNNSPYLSLVRFVVKRSGFLGWPSTWKSTGFLINQNQILTAGHNFYTKNSSISKASISVGHHGSQGIKAIKSIHHSGSIYVPDKYNKGKYKHDYCLITLNESLDVDIDFKIWTSSIEKEAQ